MSRTVITSDHRCFFFGLAEYDSFIAFSEILNKLTPGTNLLNVEKIYDRSDIVSNVRFFLIDRNQTLILHKTQAFSFPNLILSKTDT